ncbi:MAG: ABC transporter ATP-binding protein [Pseudomonadota bacterium]
MSAAAVKTETAPVMAAQGVSKSFGGVAALDDVALSLPRGAIGGLIGPNGAGKTTLFNILAGTLAPDRGAITLDGQTITGLPPHRIFASGLARTFQIPRPFPEMTVLENVMIAPKGQAGERFWLNWLAPGRIRAQERQLRDKALEIIEFCSLTRLRGERAASLSGGQHKLLELARALMADPALILLDEPAAGVNPALLVTLIDRIEALNARGLSFLIIEHNMDVVMSICAPIHVLARGKLIYAGDAAGARSDPAVLDAYLGDLP